jgi:hypothetical protein
MEANPAKILFCCGASLLYGEHTILADGLLKHRIVLGLAPQRDNVRGAAVFD